METWPFGLKPTFGTIPMTEGHQFGMLKFINCVHFGPITRSVTDAAIFMDVVSGYHPSDQLSYPKICNYVEELNTPILKPLRLTNISLHSGLQLCNLLRTESLHRSNS